MIIIVTDRLVWRHGREKDRKPFAFINADPRVMEFMPAPLSRKESDAYVNRLEEHIEHHGFGLYAVELRGERRFIGFIGIRIPRFDAPFMPCVEIGWRLAADVWGQGLATEGGRGVVRHAFEVLGLDELVSFTTRTNARSIRVMEKLGMMRNPAEDFEYPNLPQGHPLRPHVLYRLANPSRAPVLA